MVAMRRRDTIIGGQFCLHVFVFIDCRRPRQLVYWKCREVQDTAVERRKMPDYGLERWRRGAHDSSHQ